MKLTPISTITKLIHLFYTAFLTIPRFFILTLPNTNFYYVIFLFLFDKTTYFAEVTSYLFLFANKRRLLVFFYLRIQNQLWL